MTGDTLFPAPPADIRYTHIGERGMMHTKLLMSVILGMAVSPPVRAQDALELPGRAPASWIGSRSGTSKGAAAVRRRLLPYISQAGFRSSFIEPVGRRHPGVVRLPAFQRRDNVTAVRGAARIGTLIGMGLGLAMGSDAFSGASLGCDAIECYGTLGKGEAKAAGAIVAGGIGFLCGSLLGAVSDADWLRHLPLEKLNVSVTPEGQPGMRLQLSLPLAGS